MHASIFKEKERESNKKKGRTIFYVFQSPLLKKKKQNQMNFYSFRFMMGFKKLSPLVGASRIFSVSLIFGCY